MVTNRRYNVSLYAVKSGRFDTKDFPTFEDALGHLRNRKDLTCFTGSPLPDNTCQYIHQGILISIFRDKEQYIVSMILRSGVVYVGQIEYL